MQLKIIAIDFENGTEKEYMVNADNGRSFLENFLKPARARMRNRKKDKCMVIHDGLVVQFQREWTGIAPNDGWTWRILIGREMSKELADLVAVKIISGFRLWGVKNPVADYDIDRKGFLRVNVFEGKTGLV